jgi:hypothetical protein
MIVAVTGVVTELDVAANAGISPVPLAPRPMLISLLVQLKVAPAVPVNVTAPVIAPLQTTWLGIAVTVGVGLTTNWNDVGVPVQAPNTGVTRIVAVTGDAVRLTALNEVMFPIPFAGRPIEGVLLFHEYEPAVPPNVTSVVASPLQSV